MSKNARATRPAASARGEPAGASSATSAIGAATVSTDIVGGDQVRTVGRRDARRRVDLLERRRPGNGDQMIAVVVAKDVRARATSLPPSTTTASRLPAVKRGEPVGQRLVDRLDVYAQAREQKLVR